MKDWDTWLLPEITRAWQIKTGQEDPYQNEEDVVEWYEQQWGYYRLFDRWSWW